MHFVDAIIFVGEARDVQDAGRKRVRLLAHAETGLKRHLKNLTTWCREHRACRTAEIATRSRVGSAWAEADRNINGKDVSPGKLMEIGVDLRQEKVSRELGAIEQDRNPAASCSVDTCDEHRRTLQLTCAGYLSIAFAAAARQLP